MEEQQTDQTSCNTQHVSTEACSHCDEYLAGWKRAQADYQNLRKEVAREKSEFAKFANERLLGEFLTAIDQFSLAMKYLPSVETLSDDARRVWENWFAGLRAVQQEWERIAKEQGLERIPTDGAFDPLLHEAVGEESREGAEAGSIILVIQDGWCLQGKVLRPARVMIAK